MNNKRKVFISKDLKEKTLALTSDKCSSIMSSKDLGKDMALLYLWDKELMHPKFNHMEGNNTFSMTDLKHENVNLKELLSSARREHDQLKKAINILSVNDSKFIWS